MSYAPRNETEYQRSSNTSRDPQPENPGIVTSSSLAAESISEGGSFAASAHSRGPTATTHENNLPSNSTLASATRLDPAPDAEARFASEEWSEASQLNAGRSLGYQESGRGPTYNLHPKSTTEGMEPSRPAGKDLQEGGFYSGDEANASWGTDIGGKRDPGRLALGEMEERNAAAAAELSSSSSRGAGERNQTGVEEGNEFEKLGGDTEA